jgi:hypothetical protein
LVLLRVAKVEHHEPIEVMHRGDPRNIRDVEVALTDAVWRIAQARRRLGNCEAALARWKIILADARVLVEQLGCDAGGWQTGRDSHAQRCPLDLFSVVHKGVPTDFTSKKAALDSLASIGCVCDFASSLVADATKASKACVARLHALRRFVVAAGTVTSAGAKQIVSSAVKIAGLPVDPLGDENDLVREAPKLPAKRPIVELVADLLRREGRYLRTHELISLLAEGGRSVASANPAASIRNSIFARRDKSPVVRMSPGLWKLREWPDDLKHERRERPSRERPRTQVQAP